MQNRVSFVENLEHAKTDDTETIYQGKKLKKYQKLYNFVKFTEFGFDIPFAKQ